MIFMLDLCWSLAKSKNEVVGIFDQIRHPRKRSKTGSWIWFGGVGGIFRYMLYVVSISKLVHRITIKQQCTSGSLDNI